MNAAEIKNLSFAYSNGKPLLRDISFAIAESEVFVIAGRSGSGKTTLCQILCGIIPHAVKGDLSGEITIQGIVPAGLGLPQIALHVGMVFQDADNQIICTTVEDELAFGLENLCMPPECIRHRVDALLAEFGFESLRYANPACLSGGQKKLLTIASVLALAPPVLILDEPMNGLDNEGCSLVFAAIEKQRQLGRTVIIVEHDLKMVTFADRWLVLDDGTVAACGAPAEILQNEDMLKEMGVWL